MGTYKLIQDIEAEDHILGPLTLRQFIFALITAFLLYIDFLIVAKGAAFLLVLFLPPTVLTGFFSAPIGGDQSTEVWALAKLHYWFKPRLRLWNQSGVKELVTITVPKKIERVYTDGLTQTEVKSRLKALANTIDTRGWAVKNIDLETYGPSFVSGDSDRLFDLGAMPAPVPEADMATSYDMLDEVNSPVAQQLNTLMDKSAQTHRQNLISQLQAPVATAPAPQPTAASAAPPNDYWFMQAAPGTKAPSQQVAPVAAAVPTAEEEALAERFKQQAAEQAKLTHGHMHTLQPLGSQPVAPPAPVAQPVTPAPVNPAIQALAYDDDKDIATLAREAHKSNPSGDDGEVVISLR